MSIAGRQEMATGSRSSGFTFQAIGSIVHGLRPPRLKAGASGVRAQMELTYYDPASGGRRYKRRVVWGFWGFWIGVLVGGLVAIIM